MNTHACVMTLLICAGLVAVGCGGSADSDLFSSDPGKGAEAGGGTVSSGGAPAGGGSASSGGSAVGGRPAVGGAGASGGLASSGGNLATSGSAGREAGGNTGTCISGVTLPPASPLITDFSDAMTDPANAGAFRFGGAMGSRVQGGILTFANPASTKGIIGVNNGALTFSATVSAPTAAGADEFPFNGLVLFIDGPACIDASAYSGVSFELSGNLGECNLTFAFAYADDLAQTSDANRGFCSGNCYPSQFALTLASKFVSFVATPNVPGMPMVAVNVRKLLGVQWQLSPSGTTSCTANFTVDNVRFQ